MKLPTISVSVMNVCGNLEDIEIRWRWYLRQNIPVLYTTSDGFKRTKNIDRQEEKENNILQIILCTNKNN